MVSAELRIWEREEKSENIVSDRHPILRFGTIKVPDTEDYEIPKFTINKIELINDSIRTREIDDETLEIAGEINENLGRELLDFMKVKKRWNQDYLYKMELHIKISEELKKVYRYNNITIDKFYRACNEKSKEKKNDKYSLFINIAGVCKKEYELVNLYDTEPGEVL